jgi:mRNA-degrading endonuclease YafQ of YafQ-DinJ toxin-antitoxin module
MLELNFKPSFVREFNLLETDLADEVVEKIELFKDRANHKALKVHKLHGRLSDYFSFSVNYKIRIVFQFISDKEAVLLAIGDHDIYR